MAKKDNKARIRKRICQLAESAFPGCRVEFVGQQGHAAKVSRTFGFRIRDDQKNKYRSNIVWIDATYGGEINEAWLVDAVKRSNN
ncbi:MAG TPA: hypothetical protein VMG10_02740 [Gemmataceae bacterium]|nr:hypothetical protein [Gemmataceae bacterium]